LVPPLAVPPGIDPAILADSARRIIARKRFLRFVQYTNRDYVVEPVHEYVAAKLQDFVEACERGESPRLIMQLPPQHGKSTLSSRHLPPWILGRNPKWKVALMSYSADWATALSRDARNILQSDEYRAVFPSVELAQDTTAADEWELTRKCGGGGMKAVGRDGGITGRPAHVLIVDDPIKNRKEADSQVVRDETWNGFGPNFRTRIQKGGGILWVATQWHHDDPIARAKALGGTNANADSYEIINLTALGESDDPLGRALEQPLAPNRYDSADLRAIRASINESDWQALYCGRPTAEEGAIFKGDWLKLEPVPPRRRGDWVFQAMDTAYSKHRDADYTVITTWRVEKNCYRLLDVVRGRLEFPELKAAAIVGAAQWHPVAILVEDIGSGKSLAQQLAAESVLPVLPWKPDGDKKLRANAVTHLFAAGKVVLPLQAPWLRDYVSELLQFPSGAHDDQVDATTMALAWAHQQGFAQQTDTKLRTLDFTVDAELPDDSSGLYAAFGINIADREFSRR
jgi:predicted phage terminase large subunit-like protein